MKYTIYISVIEWVSSKVTSNIAEELKNETIIDQIRRIKELLSMITTKLPFATPPGYIPGHYSPE